MARAEMMSQLPNFITLVRMLLTIPLAYCILSDQWLLVLVLLLVAGVSDLLDGALARRFRWESGFGKVADPIADKLTFGLVVILLTVKGMYPVWLMLIVIGRDVAILIGAGLYRLMFKRLDVDPTFVSKLNTVVQVIVPLLIILGTQEWYVSELVISALNPYGFVVAAAFAIASGVDYALVWGRRSHAEWRKTRLVSSKENAA